jgi:hypothetical protein
VLLVNKAPVRAFLCSMFNYMLAMGLILTQSPNGLLPLPHDKVQRRATQRSLHVSAWPVHAAVIFLDADTVVVNNMDEAFKCPGFCATLRHSERFNSGVMVVTPSAATFKDMLENIGKLQSYTGYSSRLCFRCLGQAKSLSRHVRPSPMPEEGISRRK